MTSNLAPDDLTTLAEQIDDISDEDQLNAAIVTAEQRLAVAPGDQRALWIVGLANHNLAVDGPRGLAAKAEASLLKLLTLDPANALALAYLGNAVIMVARDSRNLMTKASTVQKGLEKLDQAVKLSPDDLHIRLLRAGSGKRLPKLFGRKSVARDDLAHAITLIENHTPPRAVLLAETCYDLAMLMEGRATDGDRRALLARAADAAPQSAAAERAREALAAA